MQIETRIWLDGELVDSERAKIHVLSHSLHYGLGVFEGIRAYQTNDGRTAIFRLPEHLDRLFKSCNAATITIPYTQAQLHQAIIDVLKKNDLKESYIRPLVWLGEGSIGIAATDNKIRVMVAAWPWATYLGEEGLENGVKCCFSTFTRIGINSHLEKAKICGHYVNSVLAKREAISRGCAEALMLDAQGYVTEGTGENIFVIREGTLYTPPRGSSILAGITRDTIIKLAKDRGLELREKMITRSDLYFSDEIFMTGTAAEVTPISELDGRSIGNGKRGPITELLQSDYFSLIRGGNPAHAEWLTYI